MLLKWVWFMWVESRYVPCPLLQYHGYDPALLGINSPVDEEISADLEEEKMDTSTQGEGPVTDGNESQNDHT